MSPMRSKLLTLALAAVFLTACESTRQSDADIAGAGGQAALGGISNGTGAAGRDVAVGDLAGPTPGTQEDLVVNIGDRVFFDFDSYDLRPDARSLVEAWADWLRRYPQVAVAIEGHADERGTREYNLALGDRRATSARNYLIALGIAPNRVSTLSYGKERPAVVGSNDSAWAANRRAMMVVN